MLLKNFYTTVINSEVACVHFLQNNALMGEAANHDPCHKCGTLMAEKRRKPAVLAERGKMIGTDAQPIQIDEARFAGRCKYNRGRLLAGNAPATSEDGDAVVRNNRNHGTRIDGPWVFDLRQGSD